MTNKTKFTQWAVLAALCIVGFICFLVLVSEPSDQSISLGKFLLYKAFAMAAFCLCILFGKFLIRHGLLLEPRE